MPQATLVLVYDTRRASLLRGRLAQADFDFRPVPHALFSVKGEGVVATLYASGKLVVQGESPELFVQRWIEPESVRKPAAAAPPSSSAAGATPDTIPLVGSDECGKGDYFGPLVVCAVRAGPAELAELRTSAVRDSKTLSDEACLRMGAALRARYAHAIERLDPPRYNEIYQRPGQLNPMLADLHASAIRRLARAGDGVLVDKFADERLVASRLQGLDVRLEQRVRAESNPAVAAASVIAREQFLLALKQLSEEAGVDLAKGAGDPVDKAADRYLRIHGFANLGKVAKLHFKNTTKLRARGW